MIAPRLPTWRFTDRYGEEWELTCNSDTGTGILRGSDVDWEDHPVVGGLAQGLILNDEEIVWLRTTWVESTGHSRGN